MMRKHEFERYDNHKNYLCGELLNWKEQRIKDIAILERGKFTHRPRNDPKMYDGAYPFIQTGDIAKANKYIVSYKQTLSKDGIKVSKKFEEGTLLMAIAANIGDVAIVNFDTYFPDSIVAFKSKKCNNDYLFYLLLATKGELNKIKITNTQDNLNLERLNSIIKLIPPIFEQKLIANYLDTKMTQIDRKIGLLTKKATKYAELKQALINETVTRGLDKNVEMKDSEVEWIGKVPACWKISSMKQVFTYVVDNRGKTPPIEDSGIPMLEIRHLRGNSKYPLDNYDKFVSKETYDDFLRNYLAPGDILFGTVGSIGQTAIVPKEFNYCIAQNIVGLRTKNCYCPDFFYYLLTSVSFLKCMSLANKQSIQESIKISNLIRNFIPVPPRTEQKAIADYLDTKTAQIDRIIETINAEIEKLKELRKTLINDVVTGKIKVS